ncbi:MAG: DinB family protein [Bacteroidia bacterium]
MLVQELKSTLLSLSNALSALDNKDYTQTICSLEGNSIGAHTRHIIEFVQCLVEQYHCNCINYDLRKRNLQIEISKDFAQATLIELVDKLPTYDKILQLSFTNYDGKRSTVSTTYFREVVYNIEHCIHHQALIKVAFIELEKVHLIDAFFGVAPSTILAKQNS